METRPPSTVRILIAVGFAISCFGLALFLWLAFGGAIPLKAEGYRFTVPFDEATQLAQESDVRISGVSVGKVKTIDLSDSGLADATIELDAAYAPIPDDTRAILRQKTLLGETYVELTPGSDTAPSLPEGDSLPRAQVSEAVQLDEIFRTFDEPTRAAFQAWMQGQAASLRGRGDDLSVAIASLPAFADDTDRLLRLLDSQDVALSQFVRDGGEAFTALSERSGQLRGAIENGAQVFKTTADRNADLTEIFRIFPTFLRESRETLTRLEQFARDTDPVVVGLQPAARELDPTLVETQRLAPVLDSFFSALLGTLEVGPKGLKATRALLDSPLPQILKGFNPWLASFNPILEVVRMYKREVAAAAREPRRCQQRRLLRHDPGQVVPLRPHGGSAGSGRDFDLSEPAAADPHQPVLQVRGLLRHPRRAEVVRGPPVQHGHQRAARSDLAQQPGLQLAHRRRCRPGAGVLRSSAEVRLQRPAQHAVDRPGAVQPAGAVLVDRRLPRAVAVPARAPVPVGPSPCGYAARGAHPIKGNFCRARGL